MLICTHVFFAEIRFRNKKFDEICKLDSAFVEDPTPKKNLNFIVTTHSILHNVVPLRWNFLRTSPHECSGKDSV